mmetsp:Transcript_38848/g.96045  ORF Transcript_38848/g.96045 Transcript_38848/m.96045 type:complete len:595 (-) Transcript_38848:589-2373(-)
MAVAAIAAARRIREEMERAAERAKEEEGEIGLGDGSSDEEAGETLGAFGAAAMAAQVLGAALPMAATTDPAERGHEYTSVGSQILDAARLAPPSAARPHVSPKLNVTVPRWMASSPRSAPLSFGTNAPSSIDVTPFSTPQRLPPRSSIRFVALTAMQAQRLEATGAGLSSFCADLTLLVCGSATLGDGLARAQLPFQGRVKGWYNSNSLQILVALFIFSNFVVNAVEAQLLPSEGKQVGVFLGFEFFFNSCFSAELSANFYAHFFRPFWRSAWNVFDVFIVLISWLSMFGGNIPGISVLRLFRAFRVFRLFKRVESLRAIIEGVLASMKGVGNAFAILGILMGIWSCIGVEFFADAQPELFGNLLKSMFTMWQVLTGDAGYSEMARELVYTDGLYVAAPFFVLFGFVAGIVMTNVVIAILLDAYLRKTAEAQAEQRNRRRASIRQRLWLLAKVLCEGKAAVAAQVHASHVLQASFKRFLERRRRLEDKPHRSAMRALATVLSASVLELFSEQALAQLSARERLGVLAVLWSSRISRDRLTAGHLVHCTEQDTFGFAQLSPAATLAHVLLVRLQARRAEREEKAKAREKKARQRR